MRNRHIATTAALTASALLLAACGGGDDNGGSGDISGSIRTDGSSTVGPLTEAAAEGFGGENPGVKITVGTSGTGGGFEKFCAKETAISNASRPIKDDEEAPICKKNGVEYTELQVANDGITLVVNPENDWAECLTVDQLKKIWEKGSSVKSWKDVDPKFPDEEIKLYGPGTDSGTFDFFTGEVNGEEGNSRTDYSATEDDNVTVQGVAGEKGALGYYGLEYAEQNADKNKKVKVDGGAGCVEPTKETVQSGDYKPLSRPLFIYTSKAEAAKPEVGGFLEFYLQNAIDLADQAQFVPMTEEQQAKSQQALEGLGGGAGS
jgi:phosphate transport system substrate-binding protein